MIAEVVQAWQVVPDDQVVHDGQVRRVSATAQLATKAAKSFEITAWNGRVGGYRRFRLRRDDLIARVTGP